MENYILDFLKKFRKEAKEPVEVKKIGKSYYLYYSTTYWDKEEKKRKKLSRYIGKITKDGLIKKDEERYKARSIYEYGNSKLLYEIAKGIEKELEEAFPLWYKEIIAMGIIKVIKQVPIKMMKGVYEKIHLSKEYEAHLSENTIRERLRGIGGDWEGQKRFFESLKKGKKRIVVDLSSIFSYSRNIKIAEKGYNSKHLDIKQINFIMIYSIDKGVPIYIRCIPGSMKEIKVMKWIIKEIDLEGGIVILDRGFSSYELVELLQEKGIKYIIGLQRGFKIINYKKELEGSFSYRDRGIYSSREKSKWGWVYLYEDIRMRSEEEINYIREIEEGRKKKEEMKKEKEKFGRIALISNLDLSEKEIYIYYKQREEIEILFDAMKNELESDKAYLQDEEGLRGYFFINFISMYIYSKVLQLLKEAEMIDKVSVKELLLELSKVYMIYYKDGKRHLSEIPKKVEEYCNKLNLNLFPKILRSFDS